MNLIARNQNEKERIRYLMDKPVNQPRLTKNMSWFKRHLNWAYVIALAFYFLLCYIMGMFTGILSPQTPDSIVEMRAYLLGFIIFFPVSILIIKAKCRSLWWILCAGWFSPLWLSSKQKGGEG